jgi:methyl-accepting chemotaxis protein
VESVNKVADIVTEIANASGEQSTGLEQVNQALTQMDEVTQQNSALVEENTATAKTLAQQSQAMSERIAFFRLDAGDGRAVAASKRNGARRAAA